MLLLGRGWVKLQLNDENYFQTQTQYQWFDNWILRCQRSEKLNSITYLPGVHTSLFVFVVDSVAKVRYVKQ